MKSKEEIEARIKELEKDDRYQAGLVKPATIDINAPLALLQLEAETKVETLKWVLGGK